LKKHLSTRERIPYYEEIYKRIFSGISKKADVLDLGAGINGFSYSYFEKIGLGVNYVAVEGIGQLADLMNDYFKKNKLKASAFHFSLFDSSRILKILRKLKKPRIIFLFKTLDSLETLKRNYSKELLSKLSPLADRIVISFATESMHRRRKFHADRKWILDFLKNNFKIRDDFEIGGERYIVFEG
jgi:hypothetical protein